MTRHTLAAALRVIETQDEIIARQETLIACQDRMTACQDRIIALQDAQIDTLQRRLARALEMAS